MAKLLRPPRWSGFWGCKGKPFGTSIAPIDNPEKDEQADFLAKRSITYTVLFSERDLSNTYHIVAYPTHFFIGHDGNIAKVQRGYHPTQEAAIGEQLLKMRE